jgi:outer membrane protein
MHFVRNIKFVIICFFIIFIFTQSKAEIKVVFVEMDKLMRESKVGKSLVIQLAKADNNNNKNFEKTRKNLNIKKDKISGEINILSKEEYEKKVKNLNKEFNTFKKNAEKELSSLRTKRDKAMNKILSELKILLTEYSNKNGITYIIDQKNIIIGKSELNITTEILKLLDAKLQKITLN